MSELLAPLPAAPGSPWAGSVMLPLPQAGGPGHVFGSGVGSVDRDGGGKIHPEPCSVLLSPLVSIPVELCAVAVEGIKPN